MVSNGSEKKDESITFQKLPQPERLISEPKTAKNKGGKFRSSVLGMRAYARAHTQTPND